jgi:large exoprotein involved in heme utilization and adhesion
VLLEAPRIEVRSLVYSGGVSADAEGSGLGGNVTLRASDFVRVSHSGWVSASSGGFFDGQGNGGSVLIEAAKIFIEGGVISTTTYGRGQGGNITLRASDLVRVFGGFVDAGNSGLSKGDSGSVLVEAARIEVGSDGSIQAATLSSGQGGNVTLRASDSLRVSSGGGVWTGTSFGQGNGGAVLVEAPRVHLSNGGYINAESTSGSTGNAGSITIVAADFVQLTDGSGISAKTDGPGRGGSVEVRVGRLDMGPGSSISADTSKKGVGGDISVIATGSVGLTGPDTEISSGAFGAGNAGSIVISTPVLTLNGALIRSTSEAAGLAGKIQIDASQSLSLTGGAGISTRAGSSDGGNITIRAGNLVLLRGSSITTSVESGAGNGGNIFIDPTFVILDNAQILANARDGNGGNINIVSDNFLSQNSTVEASSNLGISGRVQISGLKTDVSSGLLALNATYLDASSLIRQGCSARAARAGSSLIASGHGGLAAAPEAPGGLQAGTGAAELRLPETLSSRQATCGT